MCGIAGIIYRDQKVHEGELKKMTDKIRHRGPDAEGFFTSCRIGFGHRRLSIIDLSEGANQPFISGGCVLVFNGAIYNYFEIREELKGEGVHFKTESDTEVLLEAYKFWGENCVAKFNGMWAFAIYDQQKNTVFFSRDRFGIKPLYYFYDGEKMLFASEIKAILEICPSPKANEQTVLQFLEANFTEHNTETFFKGILKLSGSYNMVLNLSDFSLRNYRYYELRRNSEVTKLNLKESLGLFEEEFQRAVKLRLRSDVKIGSALSGGLDSSYTVAVAAKNIENPSANFTAVTVGSLRKVEDESDGAKEIAAHCGVGIAMVRPDREMFERHIDEVVKNLEEPFTGLSVFMQSFLMREAKKNGIKVLLDGQGADEILLGYSRYIGAFMKAHTVWENVKFLLRLRSHYGISFFAGIKNYLYFSNFAVRKVYLKFRASTLKNKYKKRMEYGHIKKLNNSYSDIFEMQKNELFWAQIPQLLRWEDMNAMAQGIETRLPFLDYRFVETALSIKNNFKIYDGWSKYLLRKNLVKYLPENIVWNRQKIGFNAPTEEWWPHTQHITDTINNSKIIKELFSKPFGKITDRDYEWRLYNLARWEEMYDMSL